MSFRRISSISSRQISANSESARLSSFVTRPRLERTEKYRCRAPAGADVPARSSCNSPAAPQTPEFHDSSPPSPSAKPPWPPATCGSNHQTVSHRPPPAPWLPAARCDRSPRTHFGNERKYSVKGLNSGTNSDSSTERTSHRRTVCPSLVMRLHSEFTRRSVSSTNSSASGCRISSFPVITFFRNSACVARNCSISSGVASCVHPCPSSPSWHDTAPPPAVRVPPYQHSTSEKWQVPSYSGKRPSAQPMACSSGSPNSFIRYPMRMMYSL